MHILIVTQYFYPEVGATQNRMHEFAKGLASLGYQVTVLTEVPNHPLGIISASYRHKIFTRECLEGFNVLRVWVWTSPFKTFLTRMAFYLSFMMLGIIRGALYRSRIDVVIASSPPLFVGVVGYVLSRFKRAKFIFDVRDLWPAAAVPLGELNNRILLRASEGLERFLYRRADKITAMTQGFCEYIVRSETDPQKIVRIPHGVPEAIYNSPNSVPVLWKRLGLKGEFVVTYAGNHGIAQALPSVLKAAKLLAKEHVVFLFIGEGPVKEELSQIKRRWQLDNVIFHPQVPLSEVAAYIKASDVLLVPLNKHGIFHIHIPSKLLDFMACGVPVILAADGEAKSLFTKAKAGLWVDPENPLALARAIKELQRMPSERRAELGRNGSRFVLQHYTSQQQVNRLAWVIQELC